MKWSPPGKNCGICGRKTCADFMRQVARKNKKLEDCPFYLSYKRKAQKEDIYSPKYTGKDILGVPYDFALAPIGGELSARKFVLPFRPDLVEKWRIKPGDIVLGRPAGAGCPVPHVLKVRSADYATGLIEGWVVGPAHSRGKEKVHDFKMYHMIGFEGMAVCVKKKIEFGRRMKFLPGFCMMNVAHTGVINTVLSKKEGTQVRIEGIVIL